MIDPLISPQVASYLDFLVPPRDALTAAIETEAALADFPIIGPACGHLCYLLTRLTGARQVFELGSGYGYSTAWFARAQYSTWVTLVSSLSFALQPAASAISTAITG